MRRDQGVEVEIGKSPVDDTPLAGNHDAVGTLGAAEHQRGQRIAGPGEARRIELEERQVGLLADRDRSNVVTAQATGGAFRRPTQRGPMADSVGAGL